MENNEIRTEFIITVRETNDRWFTVEAESRAEAMEKVEDWDVNCEQTTWVRDGKAKVQEVRVWVNCPNKGNGYTGVSEDIEAGTRGWHYNGKCAGEMVKGNKTGTCNKCESARQNGYRLLNQSEISYLKKEYLEWG